MCLDTYEVGCMARKKTTTLTLDEEVVKKAKKLGINISELTGTVLKGFTFEPKEYDAKILENKYKELFDAILPILKNQQINVNVGYFWDEKNPGYNSDLSLLSNGSLYISDFEAVLTFDKVINDGNISFASPKTILSNLIKAIERGRERNKEEMKDLEMVKRIIQAISPRLTSDNQPAERKKKGGVSRQK